MANLLNNLTKKPNHNRDDFKLKRIPVKVPKFFVPSIKFIANITNRTIPDLLLRFSLDELNSFNYDHESFYTFIIENSKFLPQLGENLSKYYNQSSQKEHKKIEENSIECKILKIEANLPVKIVNFLEKIRKNFEISESNLFTVLIIARLDNIHSKPEFILDYIQNGKKFFRELEEGLSYYYQEDD
ncbi:MAG: hypothetical protein ACFFAO_13550 [Candidatus Hermodarchaeota archaeon]